MKRIQFTLIFILAGFMLAYAQKDDVLKYSMKTRWAKDVDKNNPWPEYPRPQMERETFWENLNGQWQYSILDKAKSGPSRFQGKITVPFAVESELSGVKKLVGEENYLWYQRSFDKPDLETGERLMLHFGAVDWEAVVFINGKEIGTHRGGYDAFSFDVTDALQEGRQELTVRVWDPSDKGTQARGKQVADPSGIWYTPVTGIWQTVWLEKVPSTSISNLKLTPDVDNRKLDVEIFSTPSQQNLVYEIKAFDSGKEISSKELIYGSGSRQAKTSINIPEPKLWSPEDPFLYDLTITLKDQNGNTIDEVESYFGMRKVSLGKDAKGYTRIMLNDKPVFQFGLLDQGWWPDGLYTAPTEEAMLYDVEMTRKMGFNMLRKHVKVEPARFYYHCDKIGMLVWQDMPNGNYRKDLRIQAWEKEDAVRSKESSIQFENELKAMMDQFHSYPSILVWVPFNEGWGQYDTERVTAWVESYDPSRIIDSPSGWTDRGVGDVIDIHLYPGPGMEMPEANRASVLGEFGGLGYPVKNHLWWDKKNWGYLTYQDQDKFKQEFRRLISSLQGLVSTGLSAAIYTQTTDVEGEVNGLLTYDREVTKIDPKELREIIEPLYKEYWDARTLVSSSEMTPVSWKVTTDAPNGSWTSEAYDDFGWTSAQAPFSSYNNPFLDFSSDWNSDKMYARKNFNVAAKPSKLYLKHYAPKAKVKIYLNGELIQDFVDAGGRKRHYTDIDISEYAHLLKSGENTLAVEIEKTNEEASFDVGLYTTGALQDCKVTEEKQAGYSSSSTNSN